MQANQDTIYYLFAPTYVCIPKLSAIFFVCRREQAESSPYYESFKQQNQEVLLLTDAADELVLLVSANCANCSFNLRPRRRFADAQLIQRQEDSKR